MGTGVEEGAKGGRELELVGEAGRLATQAGRKAELVGWRGVQVDVGWRRADGIASDGPDQLDPHLKAGEAGSTR